MIEYWYTTKTQNNDIIGRYCLKYTEQLTDITIHSMSFLDANFDGLIDMVLIASPKSTPT